MNLNSNEDGLESLSYRPLPLTKHEKTLSNPALQDIALNEATGTLSIIKEAVNLMKKYGKKEGFINTNISNGTEGSLNHNTPLNAAIILSTEIPNLHNPSDMIGSRIPISKSSNTYKLDLYKNRNISFKLRCLTEDKESLVFGNIVPCHEMNVNIRYRSETDKCFNDLKKRIEELQFLEDVNKEDAVLLKAETDKQNTRGISDIIIKTLQSDELGNPLNKVRIPSSKHDLQNIFSNRLRTQEDMKSFDSREIKVESTGIINECLNLEKDNTQKQLFNNEVDILGDSESKEVIENQPNPDRESNENIKLIHPITRKRSSQNDDELSKNPFIDVGNLLTKNQEFDNAKSIVLSIKDEEIQPIADEIYSQANVTMTNVYHVTIEAIKMDESLKASTSHTKKFDNDELLPSIGVEESLQENRESNLQKRNLFTVTMEAMQRKHSLKESSLEEKVEKELLNLLFHEGSSVKQIVGHQAESNLDKPNFYLVTMEVLKRKESLEENSLFETICKEAFSVQPPDRECSKNHIMTDNDNISIENLKVGNISDDENENVKSLKMALDMEILNKATQEYTTTSHAQKPHLYIVKMETVENKDSFMEIDAVNNIIDEVLMFQTQEKKENELDFDPRHLQSELQPAISPERIEKNRLIFDKEILPQDSDLMKAILNQQSHLFVENMEVMPRKESLKDINILDELLVPNSGRPNLSSVDVDKNSKSSKNDMRSSNSSDIGNDQSDSSTLPLDVENPETLVIDLTKDEIQRTESLKEIDFVGNVCDDLFMLLTKEKEKNEILDETSPLPIGEFNKVGSKNSNLVIEKVKQLISDVSIKQPLKDPMTSSQPIKTVLSDDYTICGSLYDSISNSKHSGIEYEILPVEPDMVANVSPTNVVMQNINMHFQNSDEFKPNRSCEFECDHTYDQNSTTFDEHILSMSSNVDDTHSKISTTEINMIANELENNSKSTTLDPVDVKIELAELSGSFSSITEPTPSNPDESKQKIDLNDDQKLVKENVHLLSSDKNVMIDINKDLSELKSANENRFSVKMESIEKIGSFKESKVIDEINGFKLEKGEHIQQCIDLKNFQNQKETRNDNIERIQSISLSETEMINNIGNCPNSFIVKTYIPGYIDLTEDEVELMKGGKDIHLSLDGYRNRRSSNIENETIEVLCQVLEENARNINVTEGPIVSKSEKSPLISMTTETVPIKMSLNENFLIDDLNKGNSELGRLQTKEDLPCFYHGNPLKPIEEVSDDLIKNADTRESKAEAVIYIEHKNDVICNELEEIEINDLQNDVDNNLEADLKPEHFIHPTESKTPMNRISLFSAATKVMNNNVVKSTKNDLLTSERLSFSSVAVKVMKLYDLLKINKFRNESVRYDKDKRKCNPSDDEIVIHEDYMTRNPSRRSLFSITTNSSTKPFTRLNEKNVKSILLDTGKGITKSKENHNDNFVESESIITSTRKQSICSVSVEFLESKKEFENQTNDNDLDSEEYPEQDMTSSIYLISDEAVISTTQTSVTERDTFSCRRDKETLDSVEIIGKHEEQPIVISNIIASKELKEFSINYCSVDSNDVGNFYKKNSVNEEQSPEDTYIEAQISNSTKVDLQTDSFELTQTIESFKH